MTTIADEPPAAPGGPTVGIRGFGAPLRPRRPRRPRPPSRSDATADSADSVSGTPWHAPEGSDAEMAARMRLAILRLSRRLRQQVAGGVTSSQVSALATVERLGTPPSESSLRRSRYSRRA